MSYNREYYKRLRRAVIAYLGGRCIKCGFSDERALQIDHKDGDGHKELQRWTGSYAIRFYKGILEGKRNDLQLLCANCNWIKRHENSEWN